MIVANDISAADSVLGGYQPPLRCSFRSKKSPLPLMRKDEVAETIIAHLAMLLETK